MRRGSKRCLRRSDENAKDNILSLILAPSDRGSEVFAFSEKNRSRMIVFALYRIGGIKNEDG